MKSCKLSRKLGWNGQLNWIFFSRRLTLRTSSTVWCWWFHARHLTRCTDSSRPFWASYRTRRGSSFKPRSWRRASTLPPTEQYFRIHPVRSSGSTASIRPRIESWATRIKGSTVRCWAPIHSITLPAFWPLNCASMCQRSGRPWSKCFRPAELPLRAVRSPRPEVDFRRSKTGRDSPWLWSLLESWSLCWLSVAPFTSAFRGKGTKWKLWISNLNFQMMGTYRAWNS